MKSHFQKYGFWPFLASIALNLFLISFIVSGPPHPPPHSKYDSYLPLRGAVKSLSPEGQEIFKKAFIQNDDLILETKNLLIERRHDMVDKIAQDELDIDGINALMLEINDLTFVSQQGLQVLLSQTIEDLSHEDRVQLSKHMARRKGHHGRKKHGHHNEGKNVEKTSIDMENNVELQ